MNILTRKRSCSIFHVILFSISGSGLRVDVDNVRRVVLEIVKFYLCLQRLVNLLLLPRVHHRRNCEYNNNNNNDHLTGQCYLLLGVVLRFLLWFYPPTWCSVWFSSCGVSGFSPQNTDMRLTTYTEHLLLNRGGNQMQPSITDHIMISSLLYIFHSTIPHLSNRF